MFRLDGRVAFVSAAPGHLGQAMTRALAGAGAHVIVNARDDARLAAFEASLLGEGHSVERAAFDVADAVRAKAFFAALPRLDILVNNAIAMTPKPFGTLDASDFAATYASSVTASFESVRAALPALRAAASACGEASVVNVASMYGIVAPDARLYDEPGQQSRSITARRRRALLQLTRHLAAELGPENIRVNALRWSPAPSRARRSRPPTPLSPPGWPPRPCWGASARPARSPVPCSSWLPRRRPS